MKITIHRGSCQIGGCITEYEHNGFRLFVDYGDPLTGPMPCGTPVIEGLNHGDLSRSALLITHYHADHISRVHELDDSIPIYMGKVAIDIMTVQAEHMVHAGGSEGERHRLLAEKLKKANTFIPARTFKLGPFKIKPVNVDHSAFDAYAFLIKAGGQSVFHTGDFRTHGFRSGRFDEMIEKHIGHVDCVVCEATHASSPWEAHQTERELQQECEETFRQNPYCIIYTGTTNIDRLFGLYHAARRAGRVFLIDKHQEAVMQAIMQPECIWTKSNLFQFKWPKPLVLRSKRGDFMVSKELRATTLTERGYVFIARVNPRFNELIRLLPGEKKRYLSMWEGYIDPANPSYNPGMAKALGEDFALLHTSGHCSMEALEKLFTMTTPRAIIPIHTDAPAEFEARFAPRWPVRLVGDGGSLDLSTLPSPISEP